MPAEPHPKLGDKPMTHENLTITICGSARFERLFHAMNKALTLCGQTVFSLTTYPSVEGGKNWYTDDEKYLLDAAHRRKIDRSDGIVVLNRHAYVGESTLAEVAHARAAGKRVYVLESWGPGFGVHGAHSQTARDARDADGVPEAFGSPIDTQHGWGAAGLSLAWHDPLGPAGRCRGHAVEIVHAAMNPTGMEVYRG